jgi:hypothetical protein
MGQLKVEQSPLTASNDVAFTHDRAYALENGYMGREYVVLKINRAGHTFVGQNVVYTRTAFGFFKLVNFWNIKNDGYKYIAKEW